MHPSILWVAILVAVFGIVIWRLRRVERQMKETMRDAARLLVESDNPELARLGRQLEADADAAFVVTETGSIEGDIVRNRLRLRTAGWAALWSGLVFSGLLAARNTVVHDYPLLLVPLVGALVVALAGAIIAGMSWLNLKSLQRYLKE